MRLLGVTGSSGYSVGPLLHWEVATNPADTGMPKSNVLSRINPLGKYDKEAPFGGTVMSSSEESPSTYTVSGITYDVATGRPVPDLGEVNRRSPTSAQVAASSPSSPGASSLPGPSTKKTNVTLLPVMPPSGSQNQVASSGASAEQSRVDGFSAIDVNNLDLLPIRSLYNVVG